MHPRTYRVGAPLLAIQLLLMTPSCRSSTAPTAQASPGADLQAALAGDPDANTAAAAETLGPVLDAEDWYYLSHATWPDDAAVVLADPRLQKAISPLIGSATTSARFKIRPLDAPQIQSLLAQANALLQQASSGAATCARNLPAAAALAQMLASGVTTLPTPGMPADPTTNLAAVSAYGSGVSVITYPSGGGTPTTVTNPTGPCCIGELTFPGGAYQCFNDTICTGKGEPPVGGDCQCAGNVSVISFPGGTCSCPNGPAGGGSSSSSGGGASSSGSSSGSGGASCQSCAAAYNAANPGTGASGTSHAFCDNDSLCLTNYPDNSTVNVFCNVTGTTGGPGPATDGYPSQCGGTSQMVTSASCSAFTNSSITCPSYCTPQTIPEDYGGGSQCCCPPSAQSQ
jgi:hypothetical protein